MHSSRQQTSSYQSRVIEILESTPDKNKRDWEGFEVAMVKKYYRKKGARVIARALGRTLHSVHGKAREIDFGDGI